MDDAVIREMREEDIPEILDIEHISFSEPWSEAAFLGEILKSYALNRILLIGDRLVGYVCVNYLFDEAHILNLAVHPDFRRRGLATGMMNHILSELKKRGCKYIYLEVRVSNTTARAFYERFDFRVAGARKKYYVNPVEDAVLMMRRM
ncbi:MAG: ribosomal protein S18-alanine N-acetyltransferase [Nitrospirota bacterium]